MSACLRTVFAILATTSATSAFADPPQPPPPRHGIELRLVGISHDATRFSPANRDGRFDADVLRASFAIGSVGAGRETLGRLLGDRARLVVQLDVERTGAAGAILDSVQTEIEIRSSGSESPIAVAADLPWDGKDASGSFVPDGTYQYRLEAQLLSDRDHHSSLAQIEASAGSVAVDNTPPHVGMTFPVARSLTDAADLTVVGTATDPAQVATVLVNGIAAAREADRWRAVVPLVLGHNTVAVQAEDLLGNVARSAASAIVERQERVLAAPSAVAVNAAGTQAFVVDWALNTLFRVDPDTGARTVVSGPGVGSGPQFADPRTVALDEAHGRAFVGSGPYTPSGLIAVDLGTGDRTLVANEIRPFALEFDAVHERLLLATPEEQALIVLDPSTGQQQAIRGVDYVVDIALDETGENAFVISSDGSYTRIRAVHLATGEVRLVSGDGRGAGPDFTYGVSDLVLDPRRKRILVVQWSRTTTPTPLQLLAVDPASGDRTLITDGNDGSGPMPWDDLALDPIHDRLLGVATNLGALLDVDLVTGERRIVGETVIGDGPGFGHPEIIDFMAVAVDPSLSRAIVSYGENGTLLAVDLRDGARRILSGPSNGSGPPLRVPVAVAIDRASDRILVLDDYFTPTLFSVDPITGDRQIVSSAERGTGPALERAVDLAITPDGRAIAALGADFDHDGALLEIDLQTGDRRLVSGTGVGEGERMRLLRSIEIDSTGRVFVAAQLFPSGTLFSVDLPTGNRTVLSKSLAHASRSIAQIIAMGLDEVRHRALVSTSAWPSQEELVAIDLVSGARTVLAGPEIARGPGLFAGAIAGDGANDRFFVIDYALNALLVVDAESGDRVIVTK